MVLSAASGPLHAHEVSMKPFFGLVNALFKKALDRGP